MLLLAANGVKIGLTWEEGNPQFPSERVRVRVNLPEWVVEQGVKDEWLTWIYAEEIEQTVKEFGPTQRALSSLGHRAVDKLLVLLNDAYERLQVALRRRDESTEIEDLPLVSEVEEDADAT